MIHRELAAIAETLAKLPFPRRFAVEICSECNLQCVMCYQPAMERVKGVMPLELWQRCADQIADLSPDTQCWFSFCGEPLLEPDLLLLMLAYGRSVGLESLHLNTNGMLLKPELDGPLLDAGLETVVFGVDGFSKPTYENIRVEGDRDQLYANIERFLDARLARDDGPEVQVQFIEMDENEHELEAFVEYWLARGAIVKARKKLSWGARFESPLEVPAESRIPCPWAITMMHVFWDGRVPRCPGDTEGEHFVGNAWEEPLRVLWERLGRYQQLHLDGRFDELPERCQSCSDWATGAADRIRPPGLSPDKREPQGETSR